MRNTIVLFEVAGKTIIGFAPVENDEDISELQSINISFPAYIMLQMVPSKIHGAPPEPAWGMVDHLLQSLTIEIGPGVAWDYLPETHPIFMAMVEKRQALTGINPKVTLV